MEMNQMVEDFLSAYENSGTTKEGDPRNAGIWELDRLAHEEPEAAWSIILEILSRNPSENAIGMLAAGPLEDLIEYHGPAFIDRIELYARREPEFRHLLGGVWKVSTQEIWSRVETARIKSW